MSVQRVLNFDHFFCDTCRKFVYDELTGDAALHLEARTRVDDLPKSWKCPVCGASKEKLRAVTLVDEYCSLTDTPEVRADLEAEAPLRSQKTDAVNATIPLDWQAAD
jgi:rubredoxin